MVKLMVSTLTFTVASNVNNVNNRKQLIELSPGLRKFQWGSWNSFFGLRIFRS